MAVDNYLDTLPHRIDRRPLAFGVRSRNIHDDGPVGTEVPQLLDDFVIELVSLAETKLKVLARGSAK